MAIITKDTMNPSIKETFHTECSNDPKSMVALFEKVSKEQFMKDALKFRKEYKRNYAPLVTDIEFEEYVSSYYDKKDFIPRRATINSAGYDFFCPFNITLFHGDRVIIPTGIKCEITDGYTLDIYPRSSMGIKRGIILANTVGIIDSDYYNNPDNEGHILICLSYSSLSNPALGVGIKQMERITQGIFHSYYTAGNDETNPLLKTERTGGVGSTGL